MNPEVAGAYANLGVIAMRRKQWPQALERLRKAEHLAPQVAGIRLNIGLVYYRQNDFQGAIAPFESVVRDVAGLLPGAVSAGVVLLLQSALRGSGKHAGAALAAGWRSIELSVRAGDRSQ